MVLCYCRCSSSVHYFDSSRCNFTAKPAAPHAEQQQHIHSAMQQAEQDGQEAQTAQRGVANRASSAISLASSPPSSPLSRSSSCCLLSPRSPQSPISFDNIPAVYAVSTESVDRRRRLRRLADASHCDDTPAAKHSRPGPISVSMTSSRGEQRLASRKTDYVNKQVKLNKQIREARAVGDESLEYDLAVLLSVVEVQLAKLEKETQPADAMQQMEREEKDGQVEERTAAEVQELQDVLEEQSVKADRAVSKLQAAEARAEAAESAQRAEASRAASKCLAEETKARLAENKQRELQQKWTRDKHSWKQSGGREGMLTLSGDRPSSRWRSCSNKARKRWRRLKRERPERGRKRHAEEHFEQPRTSKGRRRKRSERVGRDTRSSSSRISSSRSAREASSSGTSGRAKCV